MRPLPTCPTAYMDVDSPRWSAKKWSPPPDDSADDCREATLLDLGVGSRLRPPITGTAEEGGGTTSEGWIAPSLSRKPSSGFKRLPEPGELSRPPIAIGFVVERFERPPNMPGNGNGNEKR